MSLLNDFQDTWNNPAMRHAMLVHWPIVLSVLAVLTGLILAVTGAKNKWVRMVALLMCVGVLVTGFMAMQSGQNAENSVKNTTDEAEELLEEHEELGDRVATLGLICTALTAVAFIPRKPVRITAAWLAFLACGFTAAWIANTAHHGGLLVYEHGVGTGTTRANIASPETNAEDDSTVSPAALSDDPVASAFMTDVLPILTDNCVRCHSPAKAAAKKSGWLDQSTFAGVMKGGRSGPAVVPGKPEESLLVKRIHQDISGEDVMPPPPATPLTADQIATIEKWIREMGATNR